MNVRMVDLPCPSCGQVTTLPETGLPASGEIACAGCGEVLSFRSAPHGVTGPVRLPEGGLTFAPPRHEPVELSPPAPRSTGPHVCCPACGHRFDPRTSGPARRTVLIVEDTNFFLTLATQVLGTRYAVIAARTGAEARQVLATRSVDLVVLDLTLPDADGVDVLRSMPRSGIPVLLYTSRDETQMLGADWEALRALGARDVVHKGINIEDVLLQKAGALLGR